MIGTTLAHFRITGKLGEGGMGEVWRAEDTRLGREVAVKVLPERFTADPERLARFEREARLLAALSHPNVAQVYEVGRDGERHYLVMELAEGESLAARLGRGPLPLDEALAIALQIAEALEAAHERGIVHRDLKPANVVVAGDGGVKVLDFGLAKALAPETGSAAAVELAASPTMTYQATMAGVLLGTAAYMSPEQARGRPADKRADIWAFGAVLWEMLTGEQLFAGETVSDTLAAVLRAEVAVSRLPAETPRPLVRLLARCLERDPRERLHDIADARLELVAASGATPEVDLPAAAPPLTGRPRSRWPWVVAAGGALLAALAGLGWYRATLAEPASVAPAATFRPLTRTPGLEVQPSLSPDGGFLAYASDADGDWDVYLLRVGGDKPINLTAGSPADDLQPAFSPDGRQIAFRSERDGGGVFVMGATGESARRVADLGFNPAWSPDGSRLVVATEAVGESPESRQTDSRLWIVDLASGEAAVVPGEGDRVQPAWSPGGARIAYWGLPANAGQRDLWTVAVDGTAPRPVTDDAPLDWNPVWSPDGGFLYFSSDRGGSLNLWRVAIDEASGERRGPFEPVTVPSRWAGQVSLAADGVTLAFTSLDRRTNIERVAVDPVRGEVLGPATAVTRGTSAYSRFDLSRDGRWLVLQGEGPQEDLVLLEVPTGELRRLTDDPFKDRGPVFSPDGRRIAFYSDRVGGYQLWGVGLDGSRPVRLTALAGKTVALPVWDPGGERMAVSHAISVIVRLPAPDGEPVSEAEPLPAMPEGLLFQPCDWIAGDRLVGFVLRREEGAFLPEVALLDLATGSYRRLPVGGLVGSSQYSGDPVFWPDGRRVVVGVGGDLRLVDLESGEHRLLLAAPEGSRLFFPEVSAEGEVFYLRVEEESELWLARLGSEDRSP